MTNTENMLTGLGKDGVSMDNIDQFFQESGVVVSVHVGRIRGSMEISPATMGVDMKNASIKDFFGEHVRNGQMSFIPLTLEKDCQRIENRVRMAKARMSLGYDKSFMPIEIYKQYAEVVEKAKVEYFAIRDNILTNWDGLKATFSQHLDIALTAMNPEDKEKIKSAILSRYPSKKRYEESFYMKTSLRAFPVMRNVSLLDESLTEEVKNSAVADNLNMVHEVLGIAFNDTFQIANTVYQAFDRNRKLSNKTKGALSGAIKSIKAKNLLKHPVIDKLVADLENLYRQTDSGEAMELVESILARSYGQAGELNLASYIDTGSCDLTIDDLEVMYQAYAHETEVA